MKNRRDFFRLLSLGGLAGFAAMLAGREQLKTTDADCRDRCKSCDSWHACKLPRAKRQRELLKPEGDIDV